MPGIKNDGDPEPSLNQRNDDEDAFDWEDDEDDVEDESELDEGLVGQAQELLGLTPDEAETFGEDRIRAMLARVTPPEEKPKPKPAKSTAVRDVDLGSDFDEKLVAELKHDRALIKEAMARLDKIGAANEVTAMDDLRNTLAEVSGDLTHSERKQAEAVVTAMKAGYSADDLPSDRELAELAVRAIGKTVTGADRSGQFISKPTRRRTSVNKKETEADRRENAIRNVKSFMGEAGMLD